MKQPERLLLMLTKDPTFAHGLKVRCGATATVPHQLEWGESRVPAWQRKELETHLADLWAPAQGPATAVSSLAVLTKYRVVLGPGPVSVRWKLSPSGRTWLPVLHALPAGWLSYSTEKGLYEFQDRDGPKTVNPDGKSWLVFSEGTGLFPHQEGIARPLSSLTWMKHGAARWWGLQYNKAHGSPMRKAKVPGAQREQIDAEKYVRQARDLMGGAVIACPQYGDGGPSFDFDLVEAKAATWETFPAFMSYVDKWVTLLWLWAWDNTQGGDTGSRARAEVHERVSARALASDCATLGPPLRVLWRAWCEYNRIPLEDAPSSSFEQEPDREAEAKIQQDRGQALQAMGSGMKSMREAGVDFDAAHLARQVGFELSPQEPAAPTGA
jgi:hypothetical protein